jgi:L-cysteine/cystine lyase
VAALAPIEEDAFAQAWRRQAAARSDMTFLNPGTLGGTLRAAADAADAARRRWMAEGAGAALDLSGADAYQRMRRGADRVRRTVAEWLGTSPDQVALTGNATDGLHQALLSVDWRPGDRVVSTDHEHEALDNALRQLSRRYGVVVDRVPFPAVDGDRRAVDRLAGAVDPHTRMVAVSHVSCRSGVTLDVSALARSVKGALLLVDGAHAAGTRLPLLAEGTDFYAFPGHKWLFGPVGTGVLWVSRRALAQTEPPVLGAPSLREDGTEYTGLDGAWRYEAGTRDWAALEGLGEAVRFRRAFAEAAIVRRYGELSAAFRQGLGATFPVTGAGPLLLLEMAEPRAWALARTAWRERRLLLKPTRDGIRVSLGPWLTLDEARAAAVALRELAEREERPPGAPGP